MKKINYLLLFFLSTLFLTGLMTSCSQDILDRPPLTSVNDNPETWKNPAMYELYMNDYLASYFTGFPDVGGEFSDDVVREGRQSNFNRSVPTSAIWGMGNIRAFNLFLERIEAYGKDVVDTKTYNHWEGVGRFFRGLQYSYHVTTYGDIPWYDHVVSDTDMDDLYKARDPRNMVMNNVYEDWVFALGNVDNTAPNQKVNRDVVATVISRQALREGTWQKYYYKNNEQATKFLKLAEEAAGMVINSGRYAITTSYRELFTTNNLLGNKEVILARIYNIEAGIRHSAGHYSNPRNTLALGGNTALIKSYIAVDGKAYQNSGVANVKSFAMEDLIKTRDSRFEAAFYARSIPQARGSYLFPVKYMAREIVKILEDGKDLPAEWDGVAQVTDFPELRYSEVLLNWIEAKAELATLGAGNAVTQTDIDNSINLIRSRPLHSDAEARGASKTAPLSIAELPNDPDRDPTVSPLIWEIRRERRMEFAFEGMRYADLRRWTKLEYMDTMENPDLLSGAWVNFPRDYSESINADIGVVTVDGVYKPFQNNAAQMVGFFRHTKTENRLQFLGLPNVNPYLSPVGTTQMDRYADKGYVLEQTEGWPKYSPK